MTGLCAAHQVPAIGTCDRCGVFVCLSCARQCGPKTFCPKCTALPEVDYLEAYRQKYLHRRDGYTWLFGFGSLLNVLGAVPLLLKHQTGDDLVGGGVGLALAFAQAAWFLRQRWARPVLLGVLVLVAIMVALAAGPAAVVPMLLPIGIVASAFNNTRSRLFFGLDVTREALEKDWKIYVDNRAARAAAYLGGAGVILWFLAPIGLVLGIIGLRRVDPHAHPPVGNWGYAIFGIVSGSAGTLFGLLYFLSLKLS